MARTLLKATYPAWVKIYGVICIALTAALWRVSAHQSLEARVRTEAFGGLLTAEYE
jgi:hypothetical protein